MNRIVILGGSGFVGRNLVQKLVDRKFNGKIMIHNDDIKEIDGKFRGDILSPKCFDHELKPNDIIVNLVGQYHKNRSNFVDLNITGSLNLLNSCLCNKVNKIIFASSINVYGENNSSPSKEDDLPDPQTFYGAVKMATEKIYEFYSKSHDLNVMVLRFSNLYGPKKKDGLVFNLLNAMRGKKTVLYNNGNQLRDFLFIDDAIDGIIRSIENFQQGYSIFNISSGRKYMVKDIVDIIEHLSNKKLNIEMNDISIDEQCIWADNSKAKKTLQFSPKFALDKGLEISIDHFVKS